MHSARAFHQKLLRQALAMGFSFGLSSISVGSIANAQFSSGDVPASPWSKRSETPTSSDREDTSRMQSKRLRQPSGRADATNADPIILDEPRNFRGAKQATRPAPVTLMGPLSPAGEVPPNSQSTESRVVRPERTSSASFGRLQEFQRATELDPMQASPQYQQLQPDEVNVARYPDATGSLSRSSSPTINNSELKLESRTAAPFQALTQKTPVAAQSDRHRLPAGGIALDSDNAFNSPRSAQELRRETVAPRSQLRIAVGLPDRLDDTVDDILPSQMASSKSTIGRDEPIQLKETARAKPVMDFEEDEQSLNTSSSSRLQNVRNTPARKPVAAESSPLIHLSNRAPIEFPLSEGKAERSVNRTIDIEPETLSRPKVEQRLDDSQLKRIALAEKVSHELLSSSPVDYAGVPQALESMPGWQSIEQELRQRLDRCDSLLKRGAVLSAREEASQGLLRLYRTMDLHRGKMYSEATFEKALVALREEFDFQRAIGSGSHSAVQSVVNAHSTEALKNRPLDSTSTEMAAMHYRWYARYQLVTASDGHPWAADLLYAYGKSIEKEAELNPAKATPYRNQAVVFYQAATQVKPTHSEASSQLGYALIHLDRLDDAYAILSTSLRQKPSVNAWNNLAEVFRRRGATSESEYAVQQASALSQSATQFSPENPEIIAVDPATFAKYSPMPTMASPTQNGTPANRQVAPIANDAGVRSAKSGNRFLSKIFQ